MTQPPNTIYREEALKYYLQTEEGRGLVKISPPWTWTLLVILLVALLTALLGAFLGQVEVNGRGRGIVRPTTGVRLIMSQTGGVVKNLEARSGQAVVSGNVLLRIEAPAIQSQLLEAQRQTEVVKGDYQAISERQDAAYAEQFERLANRIQHLNDQTARLKESIQIAERKLTAKQRLQKDGYISLNEVDEAKDGLAQIQRQLSVAHQDLNQAKQEQGALKNKRQEDLWARKQVVQNAETKRDSLAVVQGQTVIQAPVDGCVEAMLVRPGEVVQPGQTVCKLIPQGATLHVVSFLAEKDRAFVKTGDEVHLELDQLPYAEYGTLRAKVLRISDDLAAPFEIREALGEDQKLDTPSYRVELELTDTQTLDAAQAKLRTGMLMNVRFTLRRQRLITLVLDPLRRWFR